MVVRVYSKPTVGQNVNTCVLERKVFPGQVFMRFIKGVRARTAPGLSKRRGDRGGGSEQLLKERTNERRTKRRKIDMHDSRRHEKERRAWCGVVWYGVVWYGVVW